MTINPSSFLVYTALCLVLFKWLSWLWRVRHINRFMQNIAGPKSMLLIWQTKNLKYKRNVLSFISAIFRRYKETTACCWVGPMPLLITSDLDKIEKICSIPELQHKSIIYSPMRDFLKGGIVFISGKKWRHHRKILNPCFQNVLIVKMMEYFNTSKNAAVDEVNSLVDGREHNLHNLLGYITIRTALRAHFNTNMNKPDVWDLCNKFTYFLKEAEWKMVLDVINLKYVTMLNRTFYNTFREIFTMLDRILKTQMLTKREDNSRFFAKTESDSYESIKKPRKIFIDQCIESLRTNNISHHDAIIECGVLLIGASDTSSFTMNTVLLMLAMHPDVQERVFEELKLVFPGKDFEMTLDNIKDLPYLDMVLNETWRLFPPVPYIGRDVYEDTPLGDDLVLPKGLQVLVSIYHVQRRQDLWGPDADAFDPEHFLPDNFAKIPPYAYLPFSKGARNCIGARYAEFMIKTILAGLIRNFRFETENKFKDIRLENGLTLHHQKSPLLRIQRRS